MGYTWALGSSQLAIPRCDTQGEEVQRSLHCKKPPTPITNVTHELVLFKSTAKYQNMIRRKELPKTNRAQTRCVQCRTEGRKDVFTKWVCMGCGYLPLCNAKTKRKVHYDCFKKYHAAKKLAIMQGQRELSRQLEEVD